MPGHRAECHPKPAAVFGCPGVNEAVSKLAVPRLRHIRVAPPGLESGGTGGVHRGAKPAGAGSGVTSASLPAANSRLLGKTCRLMETVSRWGSYSRDEPSDPSPPRATVPAATEHGRLAADVSPGAFCCRRGARVGPGCPWLPHVARRGGASALRARVAAGRLAVGLDGEDPQYPCARAGVLS